MSNHAHAEGDVELLTGAYVANALNADERRFFERHLQTCRSCADEVAALSDVAARIAAAEEISPPASLRDAVIARIGTEPQLPVEAVSPRRRHRRVPGSPSSMMPRVLMPVAAVLAFIAVVSAAVAINLNTQVTELELAAQRMTAVMNAGDAQFVQMAGPGGSQVRVVMSPQLGSAVFMVSGMEPAPHAHTYELWLIGDQAPLPAGVFNVDEQGSATHLVTGDMSSVRALGVTIEPEGGSPQPSMEPLMVVPLSS